MVRKSLVALMMGVLCAGSAMGDDATGKPATPAVTKSSNGILGWFKQKSGNRSSRTTDSSSSPLAGNKALAGRHSSKSVANNDESALGKLITRNSRAADRPAGPAQGIERAVIADAERQSVAVRQTSGHPQDSAEFVHEQPVPQPTPAPLPPQQIQQAPVLPNISSVNGPQYFSATPAGLSNPIPVHPSGNWQQYQAPAPVQFTSQGQFWTVSNPGAAVGPQYVGSSPMSPQTGGMYPQTGASLYPAPIPGIPQQIGGTMIQNQAFHPHEMLYPHRYKALYPPYYYKVNGGWMVTPFGVWSNEHWHLQGTQVDVKYKSHISPFAHFSPPVWR